MRDFAVFLFFVSVKNGVKRCRNLLAGIEMKFIFMFLKPK